MTKRPPHNPYSSETTRRQAQMKRLVIFAAALAGVILGLALVPYLR